MEDIDEEEFERRSALSLDEATAEIAKLIEIAIIADQPGLNLSCYPISDLSLLSKIPNLQSLNCCSTEVSDLGPLTQLQKLQNLDCSKTEVTDLGPLAKLQTLRDLNCSDTQVSELKPLAQLQNMQKLDCSSTQLSDLKPLAQLQKLQDLDCSSTKVNDLKPIAQLQNMLYLTCAKNQVSDLTPLANLQNLKHLSINSTQVSDLTPLIKLQYLELLDCGRTQVSDLTPLAKLQELRHLYCSSTQVCDLKPLVNLQKLKDIFFSFTQVSDLTPLAGLQDLQDLRCMKSQVSDITPLSRLQNLTTLDFDRTQVSNLTALTEMPSLSDLDISHLKIACLPHDLLHSASLVKLKAYATRISGIPGEALSQSFDENCLPALRSHFADLADGVATVERVKIIVLGNGQVGKTQLRRWLLNPPGAASAFDDTIPSTHGIEVLRGPIGLPSGAAGRESVEACLWDFGGQDIYHGTHGLFMRTRAIFILCWSAQQEDNHEQELDGMVFQNQPMAYWIDYVRQLAGTDNPMLIVQTQCDDVAAEQPHRHAGLNFNDFTRPPKLLQFSAANGRGGAALREAVGEAAGWIDEQEGISIIGSGRLAVLNQLEAWRSEDSARPAELRQHKWLSQEEFAALCRETGGISSPRYLLEFLHNAGVAFYRKGLFDDRIILDLNWVMGAIYTAFDRDRCYPILKRLGGRFDGGLLGQLAWQAYGRDERKLFLSMMETCGIIFRHSPDYNPTETTEYIAPELLPDRHGVDAQFAGRWHEAEATVSRDLRFPLLHHGLIRQILARVGKKARLNAIYWRTGVLFFEQHRQSATRIEAVMDDEGWGGCIRIECQSGRAAELLDLLTEDVMNIAGDMGLSAEARPDKIPRAEASDEAQTEPAAIEPASFPRPDRQWYVSYAWGDVTTPEGIERGQRVDDLCVAAEARGIPIIRDKAVNRNGDSIERFMGEISRGDRVIVVLSEKYLQSPYCMFELYKTWERQKADPELFAQTVRWFILPCAKIGKPAERGQIGRYWREQVEEVEPYLKDLGANDLKGYHLTRQFALSVADILFTFQDTVSPRDWDGFLEYAFAD